MLLLGLLCRRSLGSSHTPPPRTSFVGEERVTSPKKVWAGGEEGAPAVPLTFSPNQVNKRKFHVIK